LRRAQGWPVNAHRVAVVPETAEQRFHHRPAAQKVRLLIVDQIGGDDSGMLVVALFHQLEKDVTLLGLEVDIPQLVDKCSAEHLSTNVKLSEMWS